MLERLTNPQPVCVHGNTGEIGMVPDVGSQPKSGYQAERLIASLSWVFETVKLSPETSMPPRSADAPEPLSANSSLRLCSTKEIMPAVLGVAKDVPEVS